MIRLRKILVSSNWKYALGEVLLIFMGITMALAANGWYSYRADRVSEAEYLERLRADLQEDVQDFLDFEGTLETKASLLLALMTETPASLLSLRRDTLMDDLNFSSFVALTNNQPVTFNELQSTGNLALIRDAQLRDELASYYSSYELISGILAQPSGPYREILWGSLPGNIVYDWRINGKPVNPSDLRTGLERLMAHQNLEAAVNSELTYTASMMFYQRQFRVQAQELLELLGTDP